MVKKADGPWQPCRDFRRLNAITRADCYPLPSMADISDSLAGNKFFSNLDWQKGYHQIPVHEADIKITLLSRLLDFSNFGCWMARSCRWPKRSLPGWKQKA